MASPVWLYARKRVPTAAGRCRGLIELMRRSRSRDGNRTCLPMSQQAALS